MKMSIQTPGCDTCYIPKSNHHMYNLQRKYPQIPSRYLKLPTNFKIIKNQKRREGLGKNKIGKINPNILVILINENGINTN